MRSFLLSWRGRRKLREAQEDWLEEKSDPEWMEPYDSWVSARRGGTTTMYVEDWIERAAKKPMAVRVGSYTNFGELIAKNLHRVDRFGIEIERNQIPINVAGKMIGVLRSDGNGPIALEGCVIKELHLRLTPRNVTLNNCRIGELRLEENSLATLQMRGGEVKRVFAPTPTAKSPFTGSVEIRGVKWSNAFENAQAYRNLRHHLTALHNHDAASTFHSAEMKAEAGQQGLVDKIVSLLYRALSNYGGSSARPLALFSLFVGFNFILLFSTDGVTLLEEPREADGWHYELYGMGNNAKLLRAAVFALSQVFNPLGIFGTRLLLSGRTPLIALISMVLGLASTVSLALFVLAIRRRFRLDRGA